MAYPQQPAPAKAPENTLGLIGLILGIASIPLAFCCGSGLLFGAAAARTLSPPATSRSTAVAR